MSEITKIEFTAWANIYANRIYTYKTKGEALALSGTDYILSVVPLRIRIDGDNITITQIKDES